MYILQGDFEDTVQCTYYRGILRTLYSVHIIGGFWEPCTVYILQGDFENSVQCTYYRGILRTLTEIWRWNIFWDLGKPCFCISASQYQTNQVYISVFPPAITRKFGYGWWKYTVSWKKRKYTGDEFWFFLPSFQTVMGTHKHGNREKFSIFFYL